LPTAGWRNGCVVLPGRKCCPAASG
jgi:hypothetical protein